MEKAIIGKKVGMSQIFDTDGKVIPVTVIEAGPCVVVQKKTAEKDGYEGQRVLRHHPRIFHRYQISVDPHLGRYPHRDMYI